MIDFRTCSITAPPPHREHLAKGRRDMWSFVGGRGSSVHHMLSLHEPRPPPMQVQPKHSSSQHVRMGFAAISCATRQREAQYTHQCIIGQRETWQSHNQQRGPDVQLVQCCPSVCKELVVQHRRSRNGKSFPLVRDSYQSSDCVS